MTDLYRKVLAHHEAGHAIAGIACNWYRTDFIALDPPERPDFGGIHRVSARSIEFEQPDQILELSIGGFIVAAAGWLSECKFRKLSGHRGPEEAFSFLGYEDDFGNPDWEGFYESQYDVQVDPVDAENRLTTAANVLGIEYPTSGMTNEAQMAAQEIIECCWGDIESLAVTLEKFGRVEGESVENYYRQARVKVVKPLCNFWCMKMGISSPKLL